MSYIISDVRKDHIFYWKMILIESDRSLAKRCHDTDGFLIGVKQCDLLLTFNG